MKAALAGVAAMPVKRETKLTALVALLSRPEGANIEDMIAATGWQKHTIRSALSHALAKKHGYQIVSEKRKTACVSTKLRGVHSDTKTIKKPDYSPSFHVLFS
jgi:hypothetical protein